MFPYYDNSVQLAVREVLARHQGCMPLGTRFSQEETLMQEQLTPTACLEKLITQFTGEHDVDTICDILDIRVEEALTDGISSTFRFNNIRYTLYVEQNTTPATLHLQKFMGNVRKSVLSFPMYEPGLCCQELTNALMDDMHCRRHGCSTLVLHGDSLYCDSCKFNLYSKGCKACGCRFGLQDEGGYHAECRH